MYKVLFALIVSILILLALLAVVPVKGVEKQDKDILVIAHRGSSLNTPANTISAFEKAIMDRADYIELDVQQTKDGAVVVVHDKDLQEIIGVGLKVGELEYSQLKLIDAGLGERIPTLEDVIEVAQGRIKLNIEIKDYGYNDEIEEKIVEMIESIADDCVITSADYQSLERVRQLNPGIKVGLIVNKIRDYSDLDVDFYCVNKNLIGIQSFIEKAHEQDREVYVWTLNSEREVDRFVRLGVDGVISDDPKKIRDLLNE